MRASFFAFAVVSIRWLLFHIGILHTWLLVQVAFGRQRVSDLLLVRRETTNSIILFVPGLETGTANFLLGQLPR